jgi:alpha-galactosidase
MFEDNTWDAWMFVAKDKSEALFEFVQVLGRPNERSRNIKLKGLDAGAYYYKGGNPDMKLSGAALMYAGINVAKMWNADGLYGDFVSKTLHFVRA